MNQFSSFSALGGGLLIELSVALLLLASGRIAGISGMGFQSGQRRAQLVSGIGEEDASRSPVSRTRSNRPLRAVVTGRISATAVLAKIGCRSVALRCRRLSASSSSGRPLDRRRTR